MGHDVVNRAAIGNLLRSVGGDLDFLEELLQDFFDDSRHQLSEMQGALAAGDAERLRRAAHTLKSNSANFGANKLVESCKSLERMGTAAALDEAAECLARAIIEYEEVKPVLIDFISGYRS